MLPSCYHCSILWCHSLLKSSGLVYLLRVRWALKVKPLCLWVPNCLFVLSFCCSVRHRLEKMSQPAVQTSHAECENKATKPCLETISVDSVSRFIHSHILRYVYLFNFCYINNSHLIVALVSFQVLWTFTLFFVSSKSSNSAASRSQRWETCGRFGQNLCYCENLRDKKRPRFPKKGMQLKTGHFFVIVRLCSLVYSDKNKTSEEAKDGSCKISSNTALGLHIKLLNKNKKSVL